ncbi:MAG: hypothetical protein RIR18_288 [Pseudomonadota bacterium]|jgi:hypothetical protein
MPFRTLVLTTFLLLSGTGCAVYSVADAAVSVASTAVKATVAVVDTAVDVASSGVRAVTGKKEK